MRKDWIDRELTMEWIVGAFMFLALLALGYFTIIIGSDNLLRRTYPLEVRFRDVSGLRKGDNVIVQGMNVGKVTEIELRDGWVTVRCALDVPMELHTDYRIDVVMTSVLGGRQLRIQRGSPDAPPAPPDAVPVGEAPSDLIAETGEMIRDVRLALTEGGILREVSEGVARINLIAGRLADGEGSIGALLRDDSAYRDLTAIMADLRHVAGRARDLAASVERGEGTLGRLIRDDAIGRNVEAVTADAAAISARLRDGQGVLGRLLAADTALFDDLSRTAAAMRGLMEKIEKGEGSIGKLIADDSLHRQATMLVDEIRAAVDDFRESTPLTTFTSILFGAL